MMDVLLLGIVIFLFALAIFDLFVGVSNDAVNFLSSALGARAASFRTIMIVAAVGIFIGAAMSNGMMDIARHGIFRPEYFSFHELICIFMAVMVTDIILLDVFNSLGMPTSTTVSMVFELLGATFAVSLIKLADDAGTLSFSDLLNTEKALSVIIGIFLSVAIAFFFGTVVQYISRLIFSFNYTHHLKWKIGIFGGVASTIIIYFLLIKGAKDLTVMTPAVKEWIHLHTWHIVVGCLLFFTLLMQLLNSLKVNVFKIVILMGTFALAMAFAGNDLVNFIGVPLTGFASYQDYAAHGAGDTHGFLMGSLNAPATTPIYFLLAAGVIMIISLVTSKKARKVVNTSVNLARQEGGEEMFGSSRIARRLVRWALSASSWMVAVTPVRVRRWIDRRFNTNEIILEEDAAFDLLRGSVNLVLASILIALGTSLKLPLSTTYVTFMVAMGSSLADRAWGRETAVFRITGVISVIGGWFITAGVAFIGAALIVSLMYWGGITVMVLVAVAAIALLIRTNLRNREKKSEEQNDALFQSILTTKDKGETWELLQIYLSEQQSRFLRFMLETYDSVTSGFLQDDTKLLARSERQLVKEKTVLKNIRRKETLCLRRINKETAIEKSAWFYLANNSCMAISYNLRRIAEVCREHVENNFRPLPAPFVTDFLPIRDRIIAIWTESLEVLSTPDPQHTADLRRRSDQVKDDISERCRTIYEHLREGDAGDLSVAYVYLNLLQETQEMMSTFRKLLRAADKLQQKSYAAA